MRPSIKRALGIIPAAFARGFSALRLRRNSWDCLDSLIRVAEESTRNQGALLEAIRIQIFLPISAICSSRIFDDVAICRGGFSRPCIETAERLKPPLHIEPRTAPLQAAPTA